MTGIYLDGDRDNGRARGGVREKMGEKGGRKKRKIRTVFSYPGENTNHHRTGTYTRQTCVEGYEVEEKKCRRKREEGEGGGRKGNRMCARSAIKIDAFDIVLRRPLNSACLFAGSRGAYAECTTGRARISNFSQKLNRFDC